MATIINNGNGGTTEVFRYNTVYGKDNKPLDIKVTGNGDNAYIYGKVKAGENRNIELFKKDVKIGNVDEDGTFVYNGGVKDGVPTSFGDENSSTESSRVSTIYAMGNNPLSLRNSEDLDGVEA